nr:variable surface lipoprotein [Mycoplasmopsis agalactiae]
MKKSKFLLLGSVASMASIPFVAAKRVFWSNWSK